MLVKNIDLMLLLKLVSLIRPVSVHGVVYVSDQTHQSYEILDNLTHLSFFGCSLFVKIWYRFHSL